MHNIYYLGLSGEHRCPLGYLFHFSMKFPEANSKDQGPVVQSIVSLTMSLRHHFVKYMLTTLSNPLLFFVEKM